MWLCVAGIGSLVKHTGAKQVALSETQASGPHSDTRWLYVAVAGIGDRAKHTGAKQVALSETQGGCVWLYVAVCGCMWLESGTGQNKWPSLRHKVAVCGCMWLESGTGSGCTTTSQLTYRQGGTKSAKSRAATQPRCTDVPDWVTTQPRCTD